MEKLAKTWGIEMRRGHTKLAVLTLLSKTALTGYDIMKEIYERTLGFWKLTAGGVYPILRELEKKGYITGVWEARGNRKKKIYEITEEGKQLMKTALQKQQQIAKTMDRLIREYALDVLDIDLPADLIDRTLTFFSLEELLKKKPIDEQVRILKRFRSHTRLKLKNIEEKLKNLQTKQL
jgi:DNA-binding PadR family transcriptional regulator